ncbi:MAG: hypothetical protein LBR92_04605 [Puniceicoccales bacterium]|nr:hypothetical protein [Puniceicoccales bacterium]
MSQIFCPLWPPHLRLALPLALASSSVLALLIFRERIVVAQGKEIEWMQFHLTPMTTTTAYTTVITAYTTETATATASL